MTRKYVIEKLGTDSFDESDARLIAELLCNVWPKPGRTVDARVTGMMKEMRTGDPKMTPRSFLIRQQGKVIAHAAMMPRTIATEDGRLSIAGLARVCSHPEHRGCGLGELVVRAAFGVVDDGEFPWSLFQTTYPVQAFYNKLGAQLVKNPIVNSLGEDPQANPFWDEIIMRYPAKADWPKGVIDLLGPGY